ncbi:hypothetical protein QR680_017500 [Steinernema hermaphroditum]|uniref:ZP domain-containing protein n=1 Tax=Steinernema hermaphroditum TaxID=289476 RepID=A0AA39HEU1_9BILA|nr:hypothetical protein QR680_017500 [Steinernema hermaphroditum]
MALTTLVFMLLWSTLPTEVLQNEMPKPECVYTIRKDEIDGPILRYAKVGDQVVHRWECNSDIYGLLVHSCYVDDAQGSKELVIDEHGCHTDRVLIGDPTYVQALNMAYREANVFKFADRVAVRFQCAIRLCLKEDGGCNDVTPPNCQLSSADFGARKRRLAPRSLSNAAALALDTDLISQTVIVLDNEEDSQRFAPEQLRTPPQRVCLSSALFAVVVSVLALLLIFITSSALYFYSRSTRFTEKCQSYRFAVHCPTAPVYE